MKGEFFKRSGNQLLVGFFPDFFFDEGGQIASIFGFAFESIADFIAFGIGDAFSDFGGNGFFVLDVVESVIHFSLLHIKTIVKLNTYILRNKDIILKKNQLSSVFYYKCKKKTFFSSSYLNSKVNTVPFSSLRVRVIEPLCRRIIWRERLRPMPVPSCFVV